MVCFGMSMSMALVVNLPPILFLTLRSMYGLSFSLLGLLISVNFTVQLAVDLIFSFFSHKFNISKTVKTMPWLAVVGFLLYGAAPVMFPRAPFLLYNFKLIRRRKLRKGLANAVLIPENNG